MKGLFVREDFDLAGLGKYGFKKVKQYNIYDNVKAVYYQKEVGALSIIKVNIQTRAVVIGYSCNYSLEEDIRSLFVTLYDLIKDNIIVKKEVDNEE